MKELYFNPSQNVILGVHDQLSSSTATSKNVHNLFAGRLGGNTITICSHPIQKLALNILVFSRKINLHKWTMDRNPLEQVTSFNYFLVKT